MQKLRNKVLITGAYAGIGRDAALTLAVRGHRVIASTHTEDQAKRLKDLVKILALPIEVIKLDICQEGDLLKAARFKPDVLINNAGIGESGPLAEVPFERLEKILETNVLGTLRATQIFSRSMLKKKTGRIITLSSMAGRIAIPYLGIYNLTKFALEAAFDALRMELEPHGIFVSLIEPGLIYTGQHDRLGFNERMADTKYFWLGRASHFAKDIPKMRRHDAQITPNSFPTTSVVDAIVHAVESARPKSRYVCPKRYWLSAFFSKFIPDRLKDRILRGYAGL